jgi:outer membrane protein assembly factor BamB
MEWQFRATNGQSCARDPAGAVTCTDDGEHRRGFEWCVNAPAVDRHGVVYANSEDGFLYAVRQGGTLRDSIFQQLNLGAAYTPASLGGDGKIYSQNAGRLFVVGDAP